MMEKRNFVTSARTPADVSDVDDILDSAAQSFGRSGRAESEFQKRAACEDERTDSRDACDDGAAE